MIRDDVISAASSAMAAKQDERIKTVLDYVLPAGWTMEDVKRRCRMVSHVGSPIQTLWVDGEPVLALHPVELQHVKTDTGWTMRLTQNYRELRPALRRGESR